MAQEEDEQRRKDVTEKHQKQLLLNSEAEKILQAEVSELKSAAVELGRKVEEGEKHLQQLKEREEARAREKEQEIEQARKAAASFEEVHTPSSPQSQVFLGTLTPLS